MAAIAPAFHVKAQFPRKFRFLLESRARYKVAYGGRGGAKSWAFARALLIRGLEGGLRVLCAREVQSSMKESVHQLLKDQIKAMGLGPKGEGGSGHYKALDAEIRGPDGTLFTFKGLSDPEALKSTEGVDICWIEEARTVTKTSWLKLDPTIRKPGSEIWVSFNPELETDYLYDLFIKRIPPENAIVIKVTWRDNPWLPEELRVQKDQMRVADYDDYLWVWEGHCRVALEGAVYAKELRTMQTEGRICPVPLEKSKPVMTFWDLGRGDMTAIWFVQIVGLQYRVVHYYQAHGFVFDHYLAKLEELRQERGWFYGTHYLPHDADHKLLGARRTIRQQAEDAGHRVRIVQKLPVNEGINAARTIFTNCWFDEEHTSEGIACLRAYHYEVEDDGTRSKNPKHDWSSHGADGFRAMGVALKDDTPKPKLKTRARPKASTGRQGWMAR